MGAPEEYTWSSAAMHLGETVNDGLVDMELWHAAWTPESWREYVLSGTGADDAEIRRNTHSGRPIGTPEFVRGLERLLRRPLTPSRGGRPLKEKPDLWPESFGLW